jgi:hypothetical protein
MRAPRPPVLPDAGSFVGRQSAGTLSPEMMLTLQRSVGNQAVQRLLQHHADSAVGAQQRKNVQRSHATAPFDVADDSDERWLGARAAATTQGAFGQMSLAEAQILFDEVKRRGFMTSTGDVQEVPFDQIVTNCTYRAHHMALQLVKAGVPCKRIYAVCAPETDDDYLWVLSETSGHGQPGAAAEILWGYHTAVSVDVREGADVKEVVFDPSIAADGPITADQWLAALHVSPGDVMRLGESHHDVVSALQNMGDIPRNNEGYPSKRVAVFRTEPEVMDYPSIDPVTRAPDPNYPGPPEYTMDDAQDNFRKARPVLEEDVRESMWRRE